MTDLRQAAQQALEALTASNDLLGTMYLKMDAITALRAALEQPEQQADYPEEKLQSVAEYISDKYHVWYGVAARDIEEVLRQSVSCGLVSNPPRREWQGLTDEEMHGLYRRAGLEAYYPRDGVVQYEYERRLDEYARAIEAALKERNT
jgi:hypothetical protein